MREVILNFKEFNNSVIWGIRVFLFVERLMNGFLLLNLVFFKIFLRTKGMLIFYF